LCVVLALRAGLEMEWASIEKPLRKVIKKYVQDGRRDCEGDQKADDMQIAEDEPLERCILLDIHMIVSDIVCE